MADAEQQKLLARLARYDCDRYPVQHATTQFHLGSLMLHRGYAGALEPLTVARDVFSRVGMTFEQAKAEIMLGVALRTTNRPAEASAAFTRAAGLLAPLRHPAEQAAATYNLGLVRQDLADTDGAHAAWDEARRLFLQVGRPGQAAAAARDHGASLLAAGRAADALPLLEEALTLAEAAGDGPGAGSAANALGLARLAAGEPAAAGTALRRALAAFPRSVRPAEYAMAKANLALAYEQAGQAARARLAARQALAVASAASAVRAQARQVLHRLDDGAQQDLLIVLDQEDREQWVPLLREEVVRATEARAHERDAVVGEFLDGLLAREAACYELAQSLLDVVLELPPQSYGVMVTALVEGLGGRPPADTERLRSIFASAMARFAIPQWQRLAASMNAAAQASGQLVRWT